MAPEPVLADPESDPTATWALEPAVVRLLAGRVVARPDAERITTTTPFTGGPLATLPVSTPEDVRAAVARARAVQPAWAQRSVADRAAVLMRFHDLVLRRQNEVLDLIQLEVGKSRLNAFEEVADTAINARWYASRASRILADTRHRSLAPGLTRVREVHHPLGVVGVVAPWNFPLILAIGDTLPALVAGNGVVLKPDSKSALTSLWAAQVLSEAGLPDGLLQIVVGDGPVVGTAVVDTCDYVCFTGSTATGRLVAARAAARLVPASLELGGKNALYVADDADLARAAEGAVRDSFTNVGQMCVHTERLLLHETIADPFLDLFLDRVRRLRLSSALDWSGDLGCLVSTDHRDRVHAHVEDAVAKGARVLVGGRPRPDLGPTFYEPTVLDGVPASALCHAQETFGPVVSVQRVSSDAEAVAVANDTEYGLNGSVWTRDLRRGEVVARQFRTGTVSVNEGVISTWGTTSSPMGGRKASGLGRRHGAAGLLRYTESQTVAVQHLVGYGPLYAQGGERFSELMTTALQATRALRLPWP